MVRVGRLRKRKVLRNRGVIHVPSDEDWAGLFREMEVEKPQHELPNSESVAVPELDTPRRNASPHNTTQRLLMHLSTGHERVLTGRHRIALLRRTSRHRASQHDTTAFNALVDGILEGIDG